MKSFEFSRYALTIGAVAALVAGCGVRQAQDDMQLPITAAGTMPQGRAASTYRVLYDFYLSRAEGAAYPLGGLLNVNGALYGTTLLGGGRRRCGEFRSCGILYSLSTSGAYNVVHAFRGSTRDGASPKAGLINVNGTLYGTTAFGGSGCGSVGCGTVYSAATAGAEKVLYDFAGGSDGAYPNQGDLLYMDGTLYGATANGGSYRCYRGNEGCGTVYSITTSGEEKVLHSFGSGKDGATPQWGLIDVRGIMYGTTPRGGAHVCGSDGEGCGTVYSISTSGVEKVLYSFSGGSDGAVPEGGLTDVKGTLYGTTQLGGGGAYCGGTDPGCGTVYSITATGKEKVLYSFRGDPDAKFPTGRLIEVSGTLYGTTSEGGAYGYGAVFSITRTGAEKVLYSFTGGADGSQADAPLIAVNGTLYGTTYQGGTHEFGTVFALSP
jgi:uncharacterized repeat protein (TIGR03803 family)